MFMRWMSLTLALILCFASVSLAEEVVLSDDALIPERDETEILPGAAGDEIELVLSENLALSAEPFEDELAPAEEALSEAVASLEAEQQGGDAASAPTLTLNASKLVIGVGEKCDALRATLTQAGEGESITWTSSRTNVAKVNKRSGRITGIKKGSTVITAATTGGLEASCKVTVRSAPGSVSLDAETLTLSVGSTHTLKAVLPEGTGSTLTYDTTDGAVAVVDPSGVVTAVGSGAAKIIVSTFNGHEATCRVSVVEAPDQVFLPSTLTVRLNESADIAATAVDAAGEPVPATFTYKAKKGTGKISVNSKTGKVVGKAVGTASIYVTAQNGVNTHLEGDRRVRTVCQVNVVDGVVLPTALTVTPAAIEAKLSEGGAQLMWAFGGPEEYGAVSFYSEDPSVATVSAEGLVTFVAPGETRVVAQTENGLTATVTVKVLPDVEDKTEYRLFAAYSFDYGSHSSSKALPFSKRNAEAVAKVFGKSEIDGQGYKTKVMGNPSKAKLLSGISDHFEDTDDNDVSVVYLCSHGHNNKDSYSSYRMVLKGYYEHKSSASYYLTAAEIFKAVNAIRGRVVLILDSCYSGTFINDMKSSLEKQNGRIAVLTAASNTSATYYIHKTKSVDFFTHFLLQGLGYNEKESWWNKNFDGDKGGYPGYLAADQKAGNKDGRVTLGEFYSFASNCIDANIPKYMKKSWYWGDKSKVQKTRFYAGSLKNLVVYRPD